MCDGRTSEPAPCRLMLSLEHGKQNLWCGTDGHWTKCVSSNRSWHSVHLSVVVLGVAADAGALVNGIVGATSGTVGAPVSTGVPPPPPDAPSGPAANADAFSAVPLAVPLPVVPAAAPPLAPFTPAPAAPAAPPLASLDVTVVELTCRLPDDLRPLDEPPTKRDLLNEKKKTIANQQI